MGVEPPGTFHGPVLDLRSGRPTGTLTFSRPDRGYASPMRLVKDSCYMRPLPPLLGRSRPQTSAEFWSSMTMPVAAVRPMAMDTVRLFVPCPLILKKHDGIYSKKRNKKRKGKLKRIPLLSIVRRLFTFCSPLRTRSLRRCIPWRPARPFPSSPSCGRCIHRRSRPRGAC